MGADEARAAQRPGPAPEVLLLPGMDGTARLSGPFAAALAPLPARVVAYPGDEALGWDALLGRVVAALPPGPCALVAESFSGPLALRAACEAPERVRAVVLVASFARAPRRGLRALACLLRPALLRRPPPDFVLRRLLAGDDAPDALLADVRAALEAVRPDVLAARLRAIAVVDAREALRRCPARLLYVAGARDRLVPARVARELAALQPRLELVTVDAPHLVLQRAPVEVAGLVAGLLGPVEPRSVTSRT